MIWLKILVVLRLGDPAVEETSCHDSRYPKFVARKAEYCGLQGLELKHINEHTME